MALEWESTGAADLFSAVQLLSRSNEPALH